MQIPKSILLLSFALQASFAPSVGARRLKSSKSSKSEKHPKPVCLQEGFQIEPDFEGIASPQTIYEDCCVDWDDFEDWSVDKGINLILVSACDSDLKESKSYNKCQEKYLWSYPFVHYNYGYDNQFEFVATNDALLGNTAFRGMIGADDTGREKVILQYQSTPPYEEDEDSLAGRPLSDLEYIEYSFKALACHSTATGGACPEQFYLNLYAKADPPRSDGWFDCAFHFTPSIGGDENGDWTTIRFAHDSVSAGSSRCGTGGLNLACTDCPAGATWGDVADLDVGYEMGASENNILVFALNMGDTSTTAAGLDSGLEGLYDRVVVKLYGEEPII